MENKKGNITGWQQGKGRQPHEWKATQKKKGAESNNQFDALEEGVVEEMPKEEGGETIKEPTNSKEWANEKFGEQIKPTQGENKKDNNNGDVPQGNDKLEGDGGNPLMLKTKG